VREKENMKKKLETQLVSMTQKTYALTEKKEIDLSLSENPLGCSPLVVSALKNIKIKLNSYPTPSAGFLKKKLADKFSLSANNFLIANGSESIINVLPRLFAKFGDEVIVPALSFPLFTICSKQAKKKVLSSKMTAKLEIDLKEITKLVSTNTSLVFICNPNNPTGLVIEKKEIIKFLNNMPTTTLVIIDEASIEFTDESMIDEVRNRDNLVVLRTFSKAFGLASLRVGFAAASEKIIKKIEEETMTFPISGLSERLASIAIEDRKFIETTKNFVIKQRGLLKKELKKMGFSVFPSETNNLFVRLPSFLDVDKFSKKLEQEEISLIMGSSFAGFDNSFFRISIRDKKTNQLFLKKMRKIIENI
jgi:histidinol-phosphate aminotransferase